ncbi:MAG: glycosyltransferase [Ignavibacteriales bacterium]|nr:MAG: glycosyltransferase [Ignavibacteriales bacterium]
MPETLFLIFIALYFIQSVIFMIGAAKKFPKIKEADFPTVTVIVAARNEEENILRCLAALDKQSYPGNKLEIIIVDDRSTDSTGKIIDDFISGKVKFKKVVTGKSIGNLKGKANALANAIEISAGEVILTTDADCEPAADWVYITASYYRKDVGMVNGFTTQHVNNSFSGMQALDFIYLLTVASGSINIGFPISCIGNNMSYRKQAYLDVGGYESLPFSVTEDSQLLNTIDKLSKYKIIYPLDEKTLVSSLPCKNFKDLYRQKKRWAIGGMNVPVRGYFVMGTAFVINLLLLLTPLFFSPVWLYLAVFKIAIDFFILYPVHKVLGLTKNLKYFFVFQFYYIVYSVMLPFTVLLSRKVIWKDRKF